MEGGAWSCDQCTLINPVSSRVCAACGWELPARRGEGFGDDLRRECGEAAGEIWSQSCLSALLMLVGNAADHPEEPKYRGPIRKSNARINSAIVQVPGAARLLALAGFVEDAESFSLPAPEVNRLKQVRAALQQQEKAVQALASPAPSTAASTPPKLVSKKKAFDENVVREIRAEVQYQASLRGQGAPASSPGLEAFQPPERKASGELRLRLRLPLGGSLEMKAPATTSVQDFQQRVRSLTGVPPIHQRVRFGFPTSVLTSGAEFQSLGDAGVQDGDVLTLEDLHDLFLGNLESGQFSMEELLSKMPPNEETEASSEVLFLKALSAFQIGMHEMDFWGGVQAKVRALLGNDDAEAGACADVETLSTGLVAVQRLFQNHDTHHRMLLVLRCLPLRHKNRHLTKLVIARNSFLFSVADQVSELSRKQMLTRLQVSYLGEKGVDAGGLTRDFFSSFATRLAEDEKLIWQRTGRGSLHPMPDPKKPDMQPSPYKLYRVCGRVFAMAMLHGCKLGCPLSRPFVRLLLNHSVPESLADLVAELNHESGAQKDFRGNKEFLERPLEELGLAGTLTYESLVPGGSEIVVTDENKEDWLRLSLKWELFGQVEHAATPFRRGLADVLGGHKELKTCPLLCLFDADTLIELWGKSGVTRPEVAIWRAVTQISSRVQQQAAWFFQVLEEDFDDELRGRVLQFATGSSSMGREGLQVFRIDVADGHDGRLPSAMTCGNMLQLPRYSCKAVLKQQLRTAVVSTGSFEML